MSKHKVARQPYQIEYDSWELSLRPYFRKNKKGVTSIKRDIKTNVSQSQSHTR